MAQLRRSVIGLQAIADAELCLRIASVSRRYNDAVRVRRGRLLPRRAARIPGSRKG